MNKLILVFFIFFILFLFGCTQSSGPICGDLVCGMDELSETSSSYCPTDCGIDDPSPNPSDRRITIPDSNDANFFTVKTNYEVGEQINIQ